MNLTQKYYKELIPVYFTFKYPELLFSKFSIFDFPRLQIYINENQDFFDRIVEVNKTVLGIKKTEKILIKEFLIFLITQFKEQSEKQLLSGRQKIYFENFLLFFTQDEDCFIFEVFKLKHHFDINEVQTMLESNIMKTEFKDIKYHYIIKL